MIPLRIVLTLVCLALAGLAKAECYPAAVVGIDLGSQGYSRPFLTIDAEGIASLRQRDGEAIEHVLALTTTERDALFDVVTPLSSLDEAAIVQSLTPTMPIADGIETTISLQRGELCHVVSLRDTALLAEQFPDNADLQTFRQIEEALIALVVRLQTGS